MKTDFGGYDVYSSRGDKHYAHRVRAVFFGTMTVPLKDDKGVEFTHEEGDVVRVGSPHLGYLSNVMLPANKVQGLEKGALNLARNLAARGLLVVRSQ